MEECNSNGSYIQRHLQDIQIQLKQMDNKPDAIVRELCQVEDDAAPVAIGRDMDDPISI